MSSSLWQNEQLGIKQHLDSETKKLKCRFAKNRAAFRAIQFPFSEHRYCGRLCWGSVWCGEEPPAASPTLWSGVCRMAEPPGTPSHTWKPYLGLCRRHKTLRCRKKKWNSQENIHCKAVTAGAPLGDCQLCLFAHMYNEDMFSCLFRRSRTHSFTTSLETWQR